MDLNRLRKLYPEFNNKELAGIFNQSVSSIQAWACKLKLNKSDAFWRSKDSGRFKPGHTPANKGIKGTHFSPGTEFGPGHVPANVKPVGSITIRNNYKRGTKYYYIKLSEHKWIIYHVHLWTQANGPVPAGHILVFKDRDSLNIVLKNVEPITMKENAHRNRNSTKAAESMRITWRAEKLRIKYGRLQKTRLRVGSL